MVLKIQLNFLSCKNKIWSIWMWVSLTLNLVMKNNYPYIFQSFHWSDLIARTENDEKPLKLPDSERKRREAIWELFTSECVFLIDHLMVLKHVSFVFPVTGKTICNSDIWNICYQNFVKITHNNTVLLFFEFLMIVFSSALWNLWRGFKLTGIWCLRSPTKFSVTWMSCAM